MRRLIAITVSQEWLCDINFKLKDATINDIYKFNPKQAHLYAFNVDHWYGNYVAFLHHNEFPPTPDGGSVRRYPLHEARKRFPYLFVDTNPILYRNFNYIKNILNGKKDLKHLPNGI